MKSNMNVTTGRYDFAFFVNLDLEGKKAVLDWCINMHLIADEYECPVCKSHMILVVKEDNIDGYTWVCQEEGENKHFIERSVRQGSFFQQKSNIGIIKILLMTYLWIQKATCDFIEDELILPKETVEEWLKFCREACVEICLSKSTKIGGEDVIIQIDECKFQKKKLKKNNYVGEWAYVGFEKETDKGFLEVVKKKGKIELLNVIKKFILPGSILVSGCWKLYNCLDEEEFIDLKESYNIKFEDLGIGLGSSVIGLRRSVKRTLNDIPRISCDFDVYVAEYMWRRLNSDIPYELIRSFLEEIKIIFPPRNKDSEEYAF